MSTTWTGFNCPNCGSQNTEELDHPSRNTGFGDDVPTLEIPVWCKDCEAHWTNLYPLIEARIYELDDLDDPESDTHIASVHRRDAPPETIP